MVKRKIRHQRLYEQVIDEIEKQVQEGQLKLGDKLPPERVLAEELGVSRGTLRDAFRILESQGVIETRPGGGRYLRKNFRGEVSHSHSIFDDLRKAAIFDLIEVRELLETGMMDLVCERITDEEITKLEKMLDEQSRGKKDVKADYVFHQALAEISKNVVIINFMKLNLEIFNQAREKSFTEDVYYQEAHKEHLDILEAIKLRDINLAKKMVKVHLENIRRRIEQEK